ncbi:MAG: MBL fold metallo-hydrolase [Myxococcales bacterium]|nr:MBL fold metallo-hydrolase [Myxococcales bacterium]MCB9568344.1 MBL fold metallo-hydrolase [Myxococcales bacterium]MCB9705068.1 MBL fold metallo-hydrolase [Myxococcales bacterium]
MASREERAEGAIAIARDVHWVGFYENATRLQCNPYLLVDDDDVVFFDPGSIPDFPKIMRKVLDLVNPGAITWIVVSHQDPDVCGNLAVVEDVLDNPALRIAAHTHTARLIDHLGLRTPIHRVDRHGHAITLKSGRVLEFIHLPYLHSPGAIATFDRQRGFLFSGDLFGAITRNGDIFSTAGFPGTLDAFHQAYMPSNAVLRRGLARLEGLPIRAILPQHGSVIEGPNVRVAFDHLRALPCGEDCDEGGDA